MVDFAVSFTDLDVPPSNEWPLGNPNIPGHFGGVRILVLGWIFFNPNAGGEVVSVLR